MRLLVLVFLLLSGCTDGDDPFKPCTITEYWGVRGNVLVVDSTLIENCRT